MKTDITARDLSGFQGLKGVFCLSMGLKCSWWWEDSTSLDLNTQLVKKQIFESEAQVSSKQTEDGLITPAAGENKSNEIFNMHGLCK